MPNTLSIPYTSKRNFRTLLDAVRSDRVCLMSVFDSTQNAPATVVCAINFYECEEAPYEFVPFAMLCEGDPYQRFVPPHNEMEACHDE